MVRTVVDIQCGGGREVEVSVHAPGCVMVTKVGVVSADDAEAIARDILDAVARSRARDRARDPDMKPLALRTLVDMLLSMRRRY